MPDESAKRHPNKAAFSWRHYWSSGVGFLWAKWALRRATSVGARVRLFGKASIINEGTMIIGERVQLISTITPLELVAANGGKLIIGDRSFINYGCSIAAQQLVQIGANCQIGTYVIMMDNDFHRLEPERRLERPPSAPIILKDNVWLGARVIVLNGVTIGEGSVVGAGSVVTRDIPPRSLAVGMPAKPIRQL